MNKCLLCFSILFFCKPVLSADIEKMKLDAAKRFACSKSSPCSINSKGHNGTYVIKVNRVTINKNGVININHYKFRRFTYNATGKYLSEMNDK